MSKDIAIYENLVTSWKKVGVKVNHGLTELEIKELENRLKFEFPDDFRLYLKQANGLEDFEWDIEMISFWSAQRIENEFPDQPATLICFADYLINSHTFGFNRETKKIYVSYWGLNLIEPFADSFTEFISIYLNEKGKLLQ
ncbi:SMI1/KNR4 family protein [Sabulibacter ruber]|uniref:SMI1/KNR4 family protein n=1 Tax=Sabulibacter ruber TaxID=2811901 RepID=UPI001A96C15C|nr:SMI1/KNR4 family protein [Sabulibacter ruber]